MYKFINLVVMTHPRYQTFIERVTSCALKCKYSADICQEAQPDCVSLYQDCADLCWICAAALLNRGPHFIAAVSRACVEMCETCVKLSEQYPGGQHQQCAIACQAVIEEYRDIAGLILLQKQAEGSPSGQVTYVTSVFGL